MFMHNDREYKNILCVYCVVIKHYESPQKEL